MGQDAFFNMIFMYFIDDCKIRLPKCAPIGNSQRLTRHSIHEGSPEATLTLVILRTTIGCGGRLVNLHTILVVAILGELITGQLPFEPCKTPFVGVVGIVGQRSRGSKQSR